MEPRPGHPWPTYDDVKLAKNLGINEGTKVLDVGGGNHPFTFATVVTDLTFDDDRHRGGAAIARDSERIWIECDIHDLPFGDKEFDVVLCRHVLEHVEDPKTACEELMRVARRGFLETPSKINEFLHGYPGHIWLVSRKESGLLFEPKPFIENPFFNITRQLHYANGHFRERFEGPFRDVFCAQLYWVDEFEVEVRPRGEFDFQYADPLQACAAHLDYAVNYMLYEDGAMWEEIVEHLKVAEGLQPGNRFVASIANAFSCRSRDPILYRQTIRCARAMVMRDGLIANRAVDVSGDLADEFGLPYRLTSWRDERERELTLSHVTQLGSSFAEESLKREEMVNVLRRELSHLSRQVIEQEARVLGAVEDGRRATEKASETMERVASLAEGIKNATVRLERLAARGWWRRVWGEKGE